VHAFPSTASALLPEALPPCVSELPVLLLPLPQPIIETAITPASNIAEILFHTFFIFLPPYFLMFMFLCIFAGKTLPW
jgi:hypothetical protein